MKSTPRQPELVDALYRVRSIVEAIGDEKVLYSFYVEYGRRLFTLYLICEVCPCRDSVIIDLGASPFIMSCALKFMGYDVVAVYYDPANTQPWPHSAVWK